MFQSKCKIYFQDSNPKSKHRLAIGEEDVGQYFKAWNTNPEVLQATSFYLYFYFGCRARKGCTQMKKNTFALKIETEGHGYVSYNITEITKNHQGGYKQCDVD